MNILGISAYYHDSAATIIQNNNIIAAAQEERFTRIKHDSSFPVNSVIFCLKYAGLSLDELDAVVFYEKPFLKFERLLETYYAFAPKGLKSFLIAMPVWIKEKLFLKKTIIDELGKIGKFNRKKAKLFFSEHHLSHAASAFFPSPFNEAAILTLDGVGEWATASIGFGKGNSIEVIKEIHFPHSLGLLYSSFTYFLGFMVNSGEYKLMGLAPYGNKDSENVSKYIDIIKNKLVVIYEDGSIWLDPHFFNYSTGKRMINEHKWERLFGFPRRLPETGIEQHHCDLAYSIQQVTNEIVINMAKEAKQLTGAKNLCLAGGVALNCVTNGELLKTGIFENIFIQPASGDAGGSLGSALAANYIFYNNIRIVDNNKDGMNGAFLGPEYSDIDIQLMAKHFKSVYSRIYSLEELTDKVSDLLIEGNVIGWFHGRMEFGPRALGNRSIIGDAKIPEMQKKLNLKIKHREGFRPFAPSVLAEDCNHYFDIDVDSPYMLLVAKVNKERRNVLPEFYNELPIMERLYFNRSDLPAITHVDFSARIHTVQKETNPVYWDLINKYKKKSGFGIIVNTSFNVRGEPIVCSPEDAYKCFMRTEMDYLVIGNFLFSKAEQTNVNNKSIWSIKVKAD